MGIIVTKKKYIKVPVEDPINNIEMDYKNGVHPIFVEENKRKRLHNSSKRSPESFTGDVV